MYNGRLDDDTIENVYVPRDGQVTLISNDGDSEYDVAIVENYEDALVSGVDAEKQIIYNKFDPSNPIDMSDGTATGGAFLTNEYNKTMSLATLANGAIVTVKKSADKKVIYAVSSSSVVTGTLEKITKAKTGRSAIVVDGKEYELTSACAVRDAEKLVIGSYIEVKLNYRGYAAKVDFASKESSNFAFAIRYTTEFDDGEDVEFLRFLTADDKIMTKRLPEKIKIDGKTCKKAAEQHAALALGFGTSDTDNNRVFSYETDEEGNFTSIDTSYVNTAYESADGTLSVLHDSGNVEMGVKSGGAVRVPGWGANTGGIVYKFDPKTVICFYINTSTTEEKDRYRSMSSGQLGNDKNYKLKSYTVEDKHTADIMVAALEITDGNVSSNYASAITSDIEKTNIDGDMYYKLMVSTGGAAKELLIPEDVFTENGYAALNPGDIIRYDAIDGVLTGNSLRRVYDYVNDTLDYDTSAFGDYRNVRHTSSMSGEYVYTLGYVYDCKADIYSMCRTDDIDDLATFDLFDPAKNGTLAPHTSFVLVTPQRNGFDVTVATSKDIKAYAECGAEASRMILNTYYGQAGGNAFVINR